MHRCSAAVTNSVEGSVKANGWQSCQASPIYLRKYQLVSDVSIISTHFKYKSGGIYLQLASLGQLVRS